MAARKSDGKKRAKPLNVYSMNLGGIETGIVATTSGKRAAELFRTSLYDFRSFGGETFNPETCGIALAEPEVVFVKPNTMRLGEQWRKRDKA